MGLASWGIRIRFSPWFLALVLAAALAGRPLELALLFFLLLGHELAHLLTALLVGVQVQALELGPLGGRITVHLPGQDPPAEALVALSGPFHNLCLLALALALSYRVAIPRAALEFFMLANLSLAGFNLLPFLPLDGGRALLAFLQGAFHRKRALQLMTRAAWYTAVVLLLAGALLCLTGHVRGGLLLTVLALSALLASSGEEIGARSGHNPVKDLLNRSLNPPPGPRVTSTLLVSEHAEVISLLEDLSRHRSYLIWIRGEDGQVRGPVSETHLLEAILQHGHEATMGDMEIP